MIESLILLSFVVGLIPALLFFFLYAVRSNWRSSDVGKAIFALGLVTAASYALSVLVLWQPEWFADEAGQWFRIITRFAIAGVLWNLLRILIKAQRDRSKTPPSYEGVTR